MKIGELAQATGTPADTIRYYEREGLLPVPARTGSNYRSYGEGHAQRLAFIRHCRSLDMTLEEIRKLLRFKDAPQEDCGEVNALLDEHIGHVAARIRELRHLQGELKALRAQCGTATDPADCGILHGLDEAARSPAAEATRRGGHAHIRGSHGRTG